MYTVGQLKHFLSKLDDDRLIVLSSDAEGNNYSPLELIESGAYEAETAWRGGAYLEKLTPELIGRGFSQEDVSEDGQQAIFLYPVN